MANLKKLAVIMAVIAGIIVLFSVVERFNHRQDFLKVFKVYKEKGKSTQFNVDDVRKGFQ